MTPLFDPPDGDPDDLKKITGVGPTLEEKLHDLGVTKLAQIANLTDEDIEKIDEALNFKGRITRDDWVGQARASSAPSDRKALRWRFPQHRSRNSAK